MSKYDAAIMSDEIRRRYPATKGWDDESIIRALYKTGSEVVKDIPFEDWDFGKKRRKKDLQ